MRLNDIGEDALVELIARKYTHPHPRILKAIGDDTSVARVGKDTALLATTDILIEGTHFKRNYTPPYFLGKKALSISLSDIAAMGGEPFFFLVSIALPPETHLDFLKEIYRGISEAAAMSGCRLAGGNTAKSPRIIISTTLFGEVPESRAVYRSGARAGDSLYVTGCLGGSALGLRLLGEKGYPGAARGRLRAAALKHLDPEPRVSEGRLISEKRLATAMIDISDGLVLDLGRLCGESGVGAVIDTEKIPVSEELGRYMAKNKKRALEMAISGGEDYELLFSSPPEKEKLISPLFRRRKTRVTKIGKIVAKSEGIRIIDGKGRVFASKTPGFRHF